MNNKTLLLAAHGSSRFNDNNPVLWLTEVLNKRKIFKEVHYGFLHQQPILKDVISQIKTQELCVIPMFSGFGYITNELIPTTLSRVGSETKVRIYDPIGIHPEIPSIMAKQAFSVIEKNTLKPTEVSVLIVAHGHTKNSQNADQTKVVASRLKKIMDGIKIDTAFIEEPPLISNWRQTTTTENLIVLPYLVGGGSHSQEDIPIMLGLIPGDYNKKPFNDRHSVQGKNIWYCRPFGFDQSLADIIVKIVSN